MSKGTMQQFLDTLPKDEKKQFYDQYKQSLMSELFQAIIDQDDQAILKLCKVAVLTLKQEHEVHTEIHNDTQNNDHHGSDKPTTKATFSLSNETIKLLEKNWFALRKKLPNKRITKTIIVETAIQIALDDFERNGIKAKLCKTLMTSL